MSEALTIRPARRSDASEIALLVNIAVHGGFARRWAADERAGNTYEPLEIGRLEMLREDTVFNWRSVTMAEMDGEIAGMMLGYRAPDVAEPIPGNTPAFMLPIEELEAEAAGTWFISMLGVHFGWRGRGVGSALLEVADRKRVETEAKGLALIVEDVNEGARRLYAQRGFAVRSKRPMAQFPGGGPYGENWLLMVKE